MGLAVLLVEEQEVSLDSGTLARLSALGITNVALVRDGRTAGLVVEGWAFDSVRSGDAAAAALGVRARTFHPFVELAVSTADHQGGAP